MYTCDMYSISTIDLIVRFTTSLPDLPLSIEHADTTTVVKLKQIIRAHLPPTESSSRIRLIYAGRLLQDDALLTIVLKRNQPPPRSSENKGKGKGKGKVKEDPPTTIPSLPLYINCSIGDQLTPLELEAETLLAERHVGTTDHADTLMNDALPLSPRQEANTSNEARGFDRLLNTGFTGPEIAQLRSQFLSIQTSIHTSASMPSPDTLLRMEDAWIDSNVSNSNAGGPVGEAAFDFGEEGTGAALDDFLWGNVIGFLWPLGCLSWAMRQEIWSERRSMAVFTGVGLGIVFGVLKVLG